MLAALDGELSAAERDAYETHLGACEACRDEAARTRRLQAALDGMPSRADVPAGLEQAVMRRVRAIAADEAAGATAGGSRWMWWLPIPAAVALALLVAVRLAAPPAPVAPIADGQMVATSRESGTPVAAPATAPAAAAVRKATPTADVPALAAAQPDLFLEMPILENLEKLQHFEDIRTVDVDGNGQDGRG